MELISNIPIRLLVKYFLRIYNCESAFYRDMNKFLLNYDYDNILLKEDLRHCYIYIKVLYESIKMKSFNLKAKNKLYRSINMSKNFINRLISYSSNEFQSPFPFVSRNFLSFTEEEEIARSFIDRRFMNKELSTAFFILEMNDKIDSQLLSYANMEDISYYPDEKEILFFPFSTFEIKKIIKKDEIYEIYLIYTGGYLNKIKNIKPINEIVIMKKPKLINIQKNIENNSNNNSSLRITKFYENEEEIKNLKDNIKMLEDINEKNNKELIETKQLNINLNHTIDNLKLNYNIEIAKYKNKIYDDENKIRDLISLKNKNQELNNEKIKLIDELNTERQKNKILNDNNKELENIIKDLKLNKSLQSEKNQ